MSNIHTLSSRAVRTATRALLIAAAGAAMPAWAMPDEPLTSGLQDLQQEVASDLTTAREYLAENKPQHALRAMASAMQSDDVMSSASLRNEVFSLMGKARAMRAAQSPSQQRVEKAQLALDEGNLILAERSATALLASSQATDAERSAAAEVVAEIASVRAAILPQIPDLMLAMNDDFASGQYARAKAALNAVQTSGVPLTAGQQSTVDHHMTMLYELERVNGVIDHTPYAATMLQAGVVKRRSAEPVEPAAPAVEAVVEAMEPVSQPTQDESKTTGQMDPIEMALGPPPPHHRRQHLWLSRSPNRSPSRSLRRCSPKTTPTRSARCSR